MVKPPFFFRFYEKVKEMRFLFFFVLMVWVWFSAFSQNLVLNPCFDEGECIQVHEERVDFQFSYWTVSGKDLAMIYQSPRIDRWPRFVFPDICNFYTEIYYRPERREVMEPVCGNNFGYGGLIHSFLGIYSAEENQLFQSFFGELSQQLEKDSIYYFSTSFSNYAGFKVTTDHIKVVLARDTTGVRRPLFVDPALIPGKNIIYERDSGDYVISFGQWEQWESCFQAKGGEQFISFLAGLPQGKDSLYRIPEPQFMEASASIPLVQQLDDPTWESLHGFIDAVKIEKLPSRIPAVVLSFCRNSCRQLELNHLPDDPRFRTADSIKWTDGVEGLFRTFPDSGMYVVSLHASCGETKVSFQVELENCAVDTVEYSLDFCISDCYELVAGAAYDSLFSLAETVRWADVEEGIYRKFPDTGKYRGELMLECVEVPIVIEVRSAVCRPLPDLWSIDLCADDGYISDDSLPESMQKWMADRWEWQTGAVLSAREFTSSGRHTLVGLRPCASETVEVDVSLRDCSDRIFVPNIFSPNGDGINDEWIYVAENISFLELEVYDRQGSRVFFSRTAGEYWDGYRDRGRYRAQPGVYVYRIEYRDRGGSTKRKTGTVTLVR